MEVRGADGVELGQELAGTIQRTQAGDAAALVDDGSQSGPCRRGKTRAADLQPWVGSAVVPRVVERHARTGVGIERDIGGRAARAALGDDAVLVSRLVLITADAAAAAAPAGFADISADAAADRERRPADGHDIGRIRGIPGGRTAVAGAGQERDGCVSRRRREDAVVSNLAEELAPAEAHGDGDHSRLVPCIVGRRADQIRIAGAVGFHEQEIGARRQRVGPLNVKGGFHFPRAFGVASAGRIGGGVVGAAILRHDGETGRVGHPEIGVKSVQIADDGGGVVGVDDRDGLAGAVALDRAVQECDLVEAIGMANLRRREPCGAGGAEMRCAAVGIVDAHRRPADAGRDRLGLHGWRGRLGSGRPWCRGRRIARADADLRSRDDSRKEQPRLQQFDHGFAGRDDLVHHVLSGLCVCPGRTEQYATTIELTTRNLISVAIAAQIMRYGRSAYMATLVL